MAFIEESTRYEKTILSDLQGAWGLLVMSNMAVLNVF